jgi:predicted nucleotidyltransferase
MAQITREQVLDRIAGAKDELRRMHVTRLELFGSVARGEAGEASDVDLLVEFEPGERISLFDFARVELFLEELLDAKVDLVMRHCVIPAMQHRVYGEAIRAA